MGALDGKTILRYAQMHRSPEQGGLEQYLWALNVGLLQRHELTILQMYLVPPGGNGRVEETRIGRGRIVWIPSSANRWSRPQLLSLRGLRRVAAYADEMRVSRLRAALRLFRHGWEYQNREAFAAMDSQPVDLVSFHWINDDVVPLMRRCIQKSIPYVIISHFDNRLMASKLQPWQLSACAGVGGISSVGAQETFGSKFVRLGDAIDTDFFDPAKAHPVEPTSPESTVLLCSRIVPEKGHLDIVQALRFSLDSGSRWRLAFAGAEGSPDFSRELRVRVSEEGLSDRVLFLGPLNRERLRDWYGASSVVVLPSYTEGLGRALLEAQAMSRPVVAYRVGGVPDAVLEGKTGLLAEKGNWRGAAESINRLLANEPLRRSMGQAGRLFVKERFELAALLSAHEEFYERTRRPMAHPGVVARHPHLRACLPRVS